MAPLIFKQLTILLWKGWILRKCHYISSIFELIFPLFMSIVVVAIYSNATKGDSSSGISNSGHGLQPPQYYDDSQYIVTYTPGQVFRNDYDYDFYYAPNTNFSNSIMNLLDREYNNSLNLVPFENEAELSVNLTSQVANQQNSWSSRKRLGIVFISDNSDRNLKYKIRLSDDNSGLYVDQLYPLKYRSGPYGSSSIYRYDFAKLQIELNEAYLNYIYSTTPVKLNRAGTKVAQIKTHLIPYPSYFDLGQGDGQFTLRDLATIILILGNIVLCPLIVKRITDEKVAKAKEMLRMMGMSDWVFWTAHFINFFSVMTFHCLMYAALYFYGWGGLSIFVFSNAFLFFCIMIVYSAATILSCMLLTTVFNRPIIAVVVSVILYICSFTVVMPFLNPQTSGSNINVDATQGWRILSCFLPNVGLQWALTLMGQCENYGYGANWANLWSPVSIYGNFNLGVVMLMMLFSCFFYGILIWYIDNVWPFQYGVPKPLYFPFLPSYWTTTKKSYTKMTSDEVTQHNESHFETEPNSRVGISCQHLKKTFSGKQAVSNVSLNMFSGQITVLLGHNGAGKTTTMNMITGIFPPSNGTAFIDGYDIRTQTKDARRSMALCPQENILYEELNVYQHLKLYSILKDHPWNDVDNEINKMLQLVALTDKKNTMSSQLSGGMKRKLSLAIAMIANSKILVLDEPTSGMDPEARRHIWDVLQSIRSQRTILLTTHYMEEADILGDRIAIMNEGLVKCCGTPMFLKKVFGAGYHLRVTKNEFFNCQTVLQVVQNFMPNAEIKSEINTEVIYSLESEERNQESNTSAQLASLFDELERRSTKLGINSCGLTVTTMEDVFIRVGNECIDNELFSKEKNGFAENGIQNNLIESMPKNFGRKLRFQQFWALILKRFHYAKRYWPMIILQTILPSLLFMVVLLIDYSLKKSFGETVPALELNLNMYGNTKGFLNYNVNEPKISEFYKKFAQNQGMSTEFISTNPNNWTLAGSNGDDIKNYIKTYLVGAQVNATDNGLLLIPWFNSEAFHTLPPSINFLYESLLQLLLPDEKVSITVYNHPIPQNNSYSAIGVVFIGLIINCFLMIPITVPFIGASYVLFPIHERISNSKLLQLMNGISPLTFWGASFVFDMINHLFACIFIFIIFAIFDWNHVFIGTGGNTTGLFFMLFLFGFASIPLAYIVSLRLKKPSSGFAVLVIIYLISGVVLMVPLGICDVRINTFNFTFMSKSTLDAILYLSRFLPVFSMSFGIQKLYKVGSYQSACDKILPEFLNSTCSSSFIDKTNQLWGCCKDLCKDDCYSNQNSLRWGKDGVAIEFTFLIISGFVYLMILWLIEGNFERLLYFFESLTKSKNATQNTGQNGLVFDVMTGQWVQKVNQEDNDVSSERQRIEYMYQRRAIHEDAIVCKDLAKTFGKLIPVNAVNRLTFGVHKEECFGLLGVNGAGKTTTFRMLTGDETVTDGNAFIDYLDLRNNLRSFQKQIGYCPQFDALLNKLTGRETLYLFCRLRGMDEKMIGIYVNELVQMTDLGKHVDKCTENYSGGNRRKLSLAIALCAAPPVIFLDEPTSGVDPSARRKIWSTLVHMQEKYQSAIILTSHSMEECEALCARIAIMVNGEFKCLGSVQHLRSKFGQGFTVMAKLKRELVEQSAYLSDLQMNFKQQLPSAVLKDIHQCLIHYHIPDTSVLWSHMFRIMEDIKSKYYLEDYIISDTTLEQIFLAFARSQR